MYFKTVRLTTIRERLKRTISTGGDDLNGLSIRTLFLLKLQNTSDSYKYSYAKPRETIPVVTHKISGHHLIFGVTQNSFQLPLRLLPSNQTKRMNQKIIILLKTKKLNGDNYVNKNPKMGCSMK